jgi:UDP:flavonoid glycosyltransferase YjiC (YdhE family)
MTTFAELDHYGARPTERYVGPIGEVGEGEDMDWPSAGAHRVFAYLRRETPDLQIILRALAASGTAVVCYGDGIPPQQVEAVVGPRFKVTRRPVNLPALLPEADLCVSYAPAGTVTTTLLRGIPQLLAPAHVEAQLTAHRVECIGSGLTLRGHLSEESTGIVLQKLLNGSIQKTRAAAFAAKYRGFDSGHAADSIVDEIESLAARRSSVAGGAPGAGSRS